MKAFSKSKVHSAEYKGCLPRKRKAVDASATKRQGESGKNLRTSGGHLNLHIDLGVGRIKKVISYMQDRCCI